MDNEKRGQSRSEYNGRFCSSAGGNQRPTGSYRTQPAGSYRSRSGYQEAREARRPTGFGSIGPREAAARRSAPDAEKAPDKAPEKKPPEDTKAARRAEKRALREARKQERAARSAEKPRGRRALKAVLIALAGALVLLLVLTLLFGGNETYHQLPTVERESVASFAPDATPVPGAEVAP